MFLSTILLLLFNSCSPEPIDELNKKINIALRNDNIIDEKEWNEFVGYATDNSQDLPELMDSENNINENELTNLILSIANKRRNQISPEIFNPKITQEVFDKAKLKIFIENSLSMDGYVKNRTEFEAALSDLLVQIQYHYDSDNMNVNFINTKIYPSQVTEVKSFVESLEPNNAPFAVGKRGVSKLNEIMEMILDSTMENNISILVSDCIYSLGKDKDTEGALEFEKSLTKGAFLEKSKEFSFTTIVLKMDSKFDGFYYDKNDKPINLQMKTRPYFFWVIGSDKNISQFIEKIELESLKGFKNSYHLSNAFNETQPYFTVLKETNKIGNFKQSDRSTKDVKSINSIEFENGTFQFSLAIDLRKIPVDQTYLINPDNYNVPDGFLIKSIVEVDRNKISQRDFVTVEKTPATHIITVSTTNKFTIQDLQLELSNKIPSWVEESNSTDDQDISSQLDKTFGLLYLVKGISESYTTQNPNNKSYFKINLTIKK